MKRSIICLLAAVLVLLCACSTRQTVTEETTQAPLPTAEPAEATVAPAAVEEEPAQTSAEAAVSSDEPQGVRQVPEAVDGWADFYLAFLDNNYDIIAALWPEGLAGVGFIDLDLDGTPEMVLFDQGASASLGAHIFDLIDGIVVCVSSGNEQAAGAFGDECLSNVYVNANYFESFTLSYNDNGYFFWVDSGNGSLEADWEEIIRFDCVGGVLSPVSVCSVTRSWDIDTGEIIDAQYTADGQSADEAAYNAAAAVYTQAQTADYTPTGVFLWSDITRYDVTYEGLMDMAQDAAEQYVPVSW